MNQFYGFFKKELIHILRDSRTLIILLLMPILMMMIFGYAINMDIKDAKIAILDYSKDELSRKISDKLVSSGYFQRYQNVNSEREIHQLFKNNEIKMAVVFQPQFAKTYQKENKAHISLITDASDPNNAVMLANYAGGIIKMFNIQTQNLPGSLINNETKYRYNENLESVYMFIPGLIALLTMLISTMMTSISIAKEKENGTMEIILVSPLKPWHIIIGKVAPYAFIAMINLAMILLLGHFQFGVPYLGNIFLLLATCILFILMALSLGILISSIATNQLMAMMISMIGLLLPTILLSGYIFPIENMPKILQYISSIFPARYFITALKSIMLKGNDISYIWKELSILSGMMILFLAISIKKFKHHLD